MKKLLIALTLIGSLTIYTPVKPLTPAQQTYLCLCIGGLAGASIGAGIAYVQNRDKPTTKEKLIPMIKKGFYGALIGTSIGGIARFLLFDDEAAYQSNDTKLCYECYQSCKTNTFIKKEKCDHLVCATCTEKIKEIANNDCKICAIVDKDEIHCVACVEDFTIKTLTVPCADCNHTYLCKGCIQKLQRQQKPCTTCRKPISYATALQKFDLPTHFGNCTFAVGPNICPDTEYTVKLVMQPCGNKDCKYHWCKACVVNYFYSSNDAKTALESFDASKKCPCNHPMSEEQKQKLHLFADFKKEDQSQNNGNTYPLEDLGNGRSRLWIPDPNHANGGRYIHFRDA